MRMSVPTVRHTEGAVLYVVSPQVVASGQFAMDACINPKLPKPLNPKPTQGADLLQRGSHPKASTLSAEMTMMRIWEAPGIVCRA